MNGTESLAEPGECAPKTFYESTVYLSFFWHHRRLCRLLDLTKRRERWKEPLGVAGAPGEQPLGYFSLAFCMTRTVCPGSEPSRSACCYRQNGQEGAGRMDLPTGLASLWMDRSHGMS